MTTIADLEKPPLDTLAHFGVKGMHWGTRKDEELVKANRRTKLESNRQQNEMSVEDTKKKADKRLRTKKVLAITGASLVTLAGIGTVAYFIKKNQVMDSTLLNALRKGSNLDITETLNKSTDLQDIIIPKGSILNRVSNVAEHGFIGDRTYASITENDARRYRILFEKHLDTKKLYNMKLSAVKDIRAPSDKQQFEIFKDLMKNNDDFAFEFTSDYRSFQDIKNNPVKTAEVNYYSFINGMISRNSTRNKIFIDAVKERGYNAMFDTNDAGIWSTKPIIVLDPSMNLAVESAKTIGLGEKIIDVLLAKNVG